MSPLDLLAMLITLTVIGAQLWVGIQARQPAAAKAAGGWAEANRF